MNNFDVRQMSSLARYQNGVRACRIVTVNTSDLTLEAPSGEQFDILPSDFEVNDYKEDNYVDCVLFKANGRVASAQLLGMTPSKFIP